MNRSLPLFVALLATACDSAPVAPASADSATARSAAAIASSTARAAAPIAAPSGSAVPAAQPSATASAIASASAAPSASAAAGSPCPAGARADDGARFCITLPANVLAISYEGSSPDEGIDEQFEIGGVTFLLQRGPAPRGATIASLRQPEKRDGAEALERGDLPSGHWAEYGASGGSRTVRAEILSGKYLVSCVSTVKEDKLELARGVCRSLRAF